MTLLQWQAPRTHSTSGSSSDSGFAGAQGLATFTFDLGGTIAINGFALWNIDRNPGGIANFDLLADNDNDPGNGATLLLDNFPTAGAGPNQSLGQTFSFPSTSASFMHLAVNDAIFSTPEFVGGGEVAFSTVPEPSTFVLCSLGIVSLGWRRRKRKHLS